MTKKILVVGAGIGGQSVAIGLKKAGFEVDIVEIHKEFNVYGVGIIQQANALRALDAIGVADEAIRRGSPYGTLSSAWCTNWRSWNSSYWTFSKP